MSSQQKEVSERREFRRAWDEPLQWLFLLFPFCISISLVLHLWDPCWCVGFLEGLSGLWEIALEKPCEPALGGTQTHHKGSSTPFIRWLILSNDHVPTLNWPFTSGNTDDGHRSSSGITHRGWPGSDIVHCHHGWYLHLLHPVNASLFTIFAAVIKLQCDILI